MIRKNADLSKNQELYTKSGNRWIFVGFAEVIDDEVIKENKNFIYYKSGYKARKEA